jgi:hypothetical protein
MRRRSEEELRGGEALDNLHGSSAKRTLPRRVNGQRGRGGACYWLSGWLEQPQTKGKEFCSPPVSEEAEVADAHKTARQQMQEEAAKELFDRQGHEPLLVAVSRVSPTESDVALGETHQPAVGDGDAMSVSAEIAQSRVSVPIHDYTRRLSELSARTAVAQTWACPGAEAEADDVDE